MLEKSDDEMVRQLEAASTEIVAALKQCRSLANTYRARLAANTNVK